MGNGTSKREDVYPADLNKLRIVHFPDPVLRKVCVPVEAFGTELEALTRRMLVIMHHADGVGLAAPQVGLLLRLFVCNAIGEPGDNDMVFINPHLVELSGAEDKEEGCLSFPNVTVTKRRASHVVIEAVDTDGQPLRKTGTGLLARIWQHEYDHLDGRLIRDNMSATDEIANRRALKLLEADFSASKRA